MSNKKLTVCPCCGNRFAGSLYAGCSCGARAVAEPLSGGVGVKLPNYGRSVLVAAGGASVAAILLIASVAAWRENPSPQTGFEDFVAAAETAAWRLKWALTPVALGVLLLGIKTFFTVRRQRALFAGMPLILSGVAASLAVLASIGALVGTTVPERMRQSETARQAALEAQGYTIQRAFVEYRVRYGSLPTDLNALKWRLPDKDGSIAAALQTVDADTYKPYAVQASTLPGGKQRGMSNTKLTNASLVNASLTDEDDEGISFTNYELRLPGADGLPRTADDWVMRDGTFDKSPQSVKVSTPKSK